MEHTYDLVVIGSGPAGQKGAIGASKLHKKVAILDRREMRPYIIKALNFMMNPDITTESTAQLSGLKFQVST